MKDDIEFLNRLRAALLDAATSESPAIEGRRVRWAVPALAASAVGLATVAVVVFSFGGHEPITRVAPTGSVGQAPIPSFAGGQGGASCAEGPSIAEVVADPTLLSFYDTVFIGTVTGFEAPADAASPPSAADFTVTVVLRGAPVESAVVSGTDGSNRVFLDLGGKYVVVAHSYPNGTTFETNACVPTQAVNAEQAQALQEIAAAGRMSHSS